MSHALFQDTHMTHHTPSHDHAAENRDDPILESAEFNKDARAKLTVEEEEHVERSSKLRATMIYEVIRAEGEYELSRPVVSLIVSGIAAGLVLGFSVLFKALLYANIADPSLRSIIAPFGYTFGFLLSILARLQLFTENTITVILPFWANPQSTKVWAIIKLWGLVFLANMLGAFLFAYYIVYSNVLPPNVQNAFYLISSYTLANDFITVMEKGVVAGFLIASLVWLLPNSRGYEYLSIILVTYVIALGGFAHVVAGGVEAWTVVLNGDGTFAAAFGGYVLPAFLGNVIGGTALFTTLAFGQVSRELIRDRLAKKP
jgi:formate/nitrite transporter FocA (FNT family)